MKLVLGPGTGLGMAALAPLPQGGWMALPGELGHVTLPVVTREEFDLREAMTEPGVVFESEFAVTGGGLLLIYRTIVRLAGRHACSSPRRKRFCRRRSTAAMPTR